MVNKTHPHIGLLVAQMLSNKTEAALLEKKENFLKQFRCSCVCMVSNFGRTSSKSSAWTLMEFQHGYANLAIPQPMPYFGPQIMVLLIMMLCIIRLMVTLQSGSNQLILLRKCCDCGVTPVSVSYPYLYKTDTFPNPNLFVSGNIHNYYSQWDIVLQNSPDYELYVVTQWIKMVLIFKISSLHFMEVFKGWNISMIFLLLGYYTMHGAVNHLHHS